MLRLAFDIGGTFTDYVLQDTATGRTRIWKVPTTVDPARAAATLWDKIAAGELSFADVSAVIHATTIATNAILERKGARTAFVTTAGFRDVLLIGRQKRYDMNDLHLEKPKAPGRSRRHLHRGGADRGRRPRRQAAGRGGARPARRLKQAGYRSVAVMFLHSYAMRRTSSAWPISCRKKSADVTLSSEVSPKFREYERASTTVANAYVQPLVARYLDALDGSMREKGLAAPLTIMQSNGGLVSRNSPAPIRCASSKVGPAAGVLMCAAVGRQLGCEHVMSFDMGGTTAKLGTIDHGEPIVTASYEVDTINAKRNSGLPLEHPRHRAAGDRRRRRQPRRHPDGADHGRPATPARCPARSATAPAGLGRPSPTPTSSWAISTPAISTAAR